MIFIPAKIVLIAGKNRTERGTSPLTPAGATFSRCHRSAQHADPALKFKEAALNKDSGTNSNSTAFQAILNATDTSACQVIDLPRFADDRGVLTFIEGGNHIPFDIARIFYLYGVPRDSVRAGHALRTCAQVVVALNGSFDVILRDGKTEERVSLSDPAKGLLIPPKIWREIVEFTEGCVCLVLASEPYDVKAYYDFYDEYLTAIGRA